jgi:hypothetical protein
LESATPVRSRRSLPRPAPAPDAQRADAWVRAGLNTIRSTPASSSAGSCPTRSGRVIPARAFSISGTDAFLSFRISRQPSTCKSRALDSPDRANAYDERVFITVPFLPRRQ